MFDRLAELRGLVISKHGEQALDVRREEEEEKVGEGEEREVPKVDGENFDDVLVYLSKIDDIKKKILSIKAKNRTLEKHIKSLLLSTSADEEKRLLEMATVLCTEARDDIFAVRKALSALYNYNAKFQEKGAISKLSEGSLRELQYQSVEVSFQNEVRSFSALSSSFFDQHKQKQKRTIQLIYLNATGDEIDDIMNSGISSNLWHMKLVDGIEDSSHIVESLSQSLIHLKKLETILLEVRNNSMQLALLVEHQDAAIEELEQKVEETVQITSDVTLQMEEIDYLDKSIKKSKMKKWIIIAIIVIIAALWLWKNVIPSMDKKKIIIMQPQQLLQIKQQLHQKYLHQIQKTNLHKQLEP